MESRIVRRFPSRRPGTQRGFSLLEMLVVVAIIGIFLGVALLSTDLVDFDRKLEREAVRLGTKLAFTSEEALMQSRDFGVVFYEEGYEFLMFEYGQGWLPAGGVGMEARLLEPDMAMQMHMDGIEVDLEPRCELFLCGVQEILADGEDEPPDVQPQIILFSSGEVTPFDLEFLRESEILDPGYLFSMGFDGKYEVNRGDGL